MVIITWDNVGAIASGINSLSQRVGTTHPHRWGEDVGRKGHETIKDVINAGGMNPTKKGGPRILSGDMISSSGFKSVTSGGTSFVEAGYGFNGSTPLQTFFQEDGTRRGITPMWSIPMTALEMENEMLDSGERMLARIAAEWNAI